VIAGHSADPVVEPQFQPGIVYSVEFEDGTAIDIHEDDIEPFED
jgi:hypothetical protein